MVARLLCLAFMVACAGSKSGPAKPESKPNRGILAAALPYSILDGRTGRQVDTAVFWTAVAAARAVCVGEDHPNPHHHWFQLEVMSQVATRKANTKLALGMEMFQRPFQGVLDDFAAKRIDEAALLSRSGYAERWGYDFGLYGPIIKTAVAAGAALLALNAPKELVKKIVRHGLESLTAEEKLQVPQLDLADKTHRAWFDATMEEMGGSHGHGNPHESKPAKPDDKSDDKPKMPSADRIYTAQVLWDETMADGAAQWLTATPAGSLVLLAGNGHCHDSAIVNRIKRRGIANVISVKPVLDLEGRVAAALAKPMNDYVVVLELPPDVKAQMDAK